MTALENIASPLAARGAADREDKVRKIARLLKIEHVLSHRPRELSNGQKQRTALSRALVAEPKVLLLDDPLRNVDAKLRYEMRLELPRLLRGFGSAVLYVTQDYKEAMALGDRIAVMISGRFIQVDTPVAIYDRPATVDVARLFGDPTINLIAASVSGGRVMVGGAPIDLTHRYGELAAREVIVGIRPEFVSMAAAGESGMQADLLAVSPFNERVVLFNQLGDGVEFMASAPIDEAARLSPGPVVLKVDPARIHLFDRASGARIAPKSEAPTGFQGAGEAVQ
jgi:multiple sugar transport system ATP-binding protein